ncbi:MAG: 16S rRNA (cytidine(1402)-2'-O)-methyltransferase [Chloroflexi bacterium]|nr:16S rRNA (cytidine(1402)-2'-O)-methyltransferase [Chloroflexota bacterium]
MSTLFLVGTPIGNLEDITLRALRVLREVRLIAAEDTRRTRLLLSRHGIATAVTSYHEHNKLSKLSQILSVLQDGMDVALVSDAGMPGISDPGFELVSAVIARGIPVVPVPGPSALISALAVSGLPTDQFVYLGYLPRQARKREEFLKSVAHEKRTLVAFEAPHRLCSSLQAMRDAWGNRRIVVARELTKVYEEIRRSTISEEVAHFATTRPRGEFTLVIEGAREEDSVTPTDRELRERLAHLQASGLDRKSATAQVARESGRSKRDVYRVWSSLSEKHPEKRPPGG